MGCERYPTSESTRPSTARATNASANGARSQPARHGVRKLEINNNEAKKRDTKMMNSIITTLFGRCRAASTREPDHNDTRAKRTDGRRADCPRPALHLLTGVLAAAALPIASARAAVPLHGARLFTDASLSTPGLVGSFVNSNLQAVKTTDDWRLTQTVAGTRVDTNLSFTTSSWGSRAAVGITGGSDANWESFSVQWDGYLQVTQAGQRFATASDDGSRMWIDLNTNGVFESGELLENGWGRTQGLSTGERSVALPAGAFRVRVQYCEASGGNELHLLSSLFVPRQFAAASDNPRQIVRAIVLNFDPRVPSEDGRRLHEVFGWGNPHQLAEQFRRDLEFATGGAIAVQIVEFRDLDDFPAKVDGFRPTADNWVKAWRSGGPWHGQSTDFERLVQEQNLVPLVNSGTVDEIWCFGPPAEVDLFGETWMAGPNAFYINGSTFPSIQFDRAVAGYGFNYERGVDCMLHNLGHRTEDSQKRPFGGWNLQNPTTPWDKYTANALESPGYIAGVGTCEVPANAQGHYDYNNLQVVQSSAYDWASFPTLTGDTKPVSATNWFFGPAPDGQRDYFNWFFGMMPRNSGTNTDGRQANWFKYLWDFNSYVAGTGRFRQREGVFSGSRFLAGSNQFFSIRYYAERGVNTNKLGNANIRVTGPNGFNQLAKLTQIVPSSDIRRVTAVYAVSAPSATWRYVDQGDYTASLQSGQLYDLSGTAFASAVLGYPQWLLYEPSAIDVRSLVAAGRASVSSTASDIGSVDNLFDQDLNTLYRTSVTNPLTVQVTFTDTQTFRGFRFYGAGSATPPAYWLNIEIANSQSDLSSRSGSYRLVYSNAPASNRVVTMLFPAASVTAKLVRLTARQLNADGVIHLYDWTLLGALAADTSAPAAYLSVTNVTAAIGAGSYMKVNFSDPSFVDTKSLSSTSILVTGPNGFLQYAVFAGSDDWRIGPVRSATYWVPAPGGAWDSADNGDYTVILQAGKVFDTAGHTHSSPQVLGTFNVSVPPPQRRPNCDLTESSASLWLAWAEGASASTTNDATRKLLGASSVRFTTDGGFDTWLRFPPAFYADWDLTAAKTLNFSVFAENYNSPQFQGNDPWIRLWDVNGNYFEYHYYSNGYQSTPLNNALGRWLAFSLPLRAADGVLNGWRRTVSGSPRLDHIASVEFHADTWGGGFRLWYDRVGFDLPVSVLSAKFTVLAGVPQIRLTFDQNVQATLATSDIQLRNMNSGAVIASSSLALSYDSAANTARFTFPGLPGGILPDAPYRLTIVSNAVADVVGNFMATNFVYDFVVLDGDGFALTGMTTTPSDVRLTWQVVAGQRYRIQWSDNLTNWNYLAEAGSTVILAPAISGLTQYAIPVNRATTPKRFFRIELVQP